MVIANREMSCVMTPFGSGGTCSSIFVESYTRCQNTHRALFPRHVFAWERWSYSFAFSLTAAVTCSNVVPCGNLRTKSSYRYFDWWYGSRFGLENGPYLIATLISESVLLGLLEERPI